MKKTPNELRTRWKELHRARRLLVRHGRNQVVALQCQRAWLALLEATVVLQPEDTAIGQAQRRHIDAYRQIMLRTADQVINPPIIIDPLLPGA